MNVLTLETLPVLDLGDKPSSYDPKSSEASQVFIPPKSDYPNTIIIKYGDYRPEFKINELSKKYKKSNLLQREVDYLTFENTLNNASRYLQPYRAHVAKLEKINIAVIILGIILTVALSMMSGILYNWIYSILVIVLFLIAMVFAYFVFKAKQNKYLRQAHFLLALFCRSENNRFYLSKNVEMRPGFLASWIEFIIHEEPENNQNDQWLFDKIKMRLIPDLLIFNDGDQEEQKYPDE